MNGDRRPPEGQGPCPEVPAPPDGRFGGGLRVEQARFHRELRFGQTDVQSAMDLRDPDHLVLDYTRLMMGFLLFQPRPQRLLMIGLGGGSLPKFCHRHLPRSDLTVVEIDPQVIALRERFDIPPDQPGFRVVQDDGARHVAAQDSGGFDVVCVDGFEHDRMAPSLGTPDFYADCARLLKAGGVMVCNLHAFDLHHAIYQERIARAFGGHTLALATAECGNSVVFARKDRAIGDRLPRRPVRPPAMPERAWAGIEAGLRETLRAARLDRSIL